MWRTRRCTRAGGSVDLEVNVKRARRVNLVVRPPEVTRMGAPDLDYEPGSLVGPLDRRDVKAFEKWLRASGYDRIRFDLAYLGYLARFHGGSPRKRYFRTEAGTSHVLVRFLNFLPSGSGRPLEQYNVEASWSAVSDRVGLYLMPFAELFAGDLLCFDDEAGNPPRVVAWFHEQSRSGQLPHTEPVAASFGEFLSLLRGSEAEPSAAADRGGSS